MTYDPYNVNTEKDNSMSTATIISVALSGVLLIGITVSGALVGCPSYSVYTAHKQGEAEFARAQQNRQIKVQEAQASYDAADFTARAEIRKAQGVAQANQIMSASLGGPEGYLRWKYIEMLQENTTKQVIYIPTEATLPILEAGHKNGK